MTSEFVPPLRGFVDVNGLSPPPATPGWLALPWLIGTASPPINAHHRAEADLARAVHQVAGSFVPCEDWRLQIVLQQATAAPTAQISSAVARAPRAMSAEANLARVARHAAHAAQQAAVNPGPVVNRAFSHEPPLPYYGATISAVESFHGLLAQTEGPEKPGQRPNRIYPQSGLRGTPQGFPFKLFEILTREDPRIISWSPTGRSFCVFDRLALLDILPRFDLKIRGWTNFQRQLNNYGLKQSNAEPGEPLSAYANPNFQRERPDLLTYPGVRRAVQPRPPYVRPADRRRQREKKMAEQVDPAPPSTSTSEDEFAIEDTSSVNSNHGSEEACEARLETVLDEANSPKSAKKRRATSAAEAEIAEMLAKRFCGTGVVSA